MDQLITISSISGVAHQLSMKYQLWCHLYAIHGRQMACAEMEITWHKRIQAVLMFLWVIHIPSAFPSLLYKELTCSTTNTTHPSLPSDTNLSNVSSCSGTEGRLHQFSMVFTWTEDRHFPMLWQSGATNESVRLLHTTWADGRSIRKDWISGVSNLEAQDAEKLGWSQKVQVMIQTPGDSFTFSTLGDIHGFHKF